MDDENRQRTARELRGAAGWLRLAVGERAEAPPGLTAQVPALAADPTG